MLLIKNFIKSPPFLGRLFFIIFIIYNPYQYKLQYNFKRIRKRARVDNVYPHRFRITFTTDLANRGMDIQDIQELLGHAKLETTLIYINSNKQKVKAAYKKYIN